MLKTYSSRGGILATDQYSIDKRAFPFKDETAVNVTVEKTRYEVIPTRSALPAADTAGILEFLIDPTTDGSMWDLHNSYIILNVTMSNGAGTWGLSQFGLNQLITDCDVILGSQYVNDTHVNLYPYSAFLKDVLMRPRPCVPSITADGTTATAGNILTEDALEEGNYLSHPLFTMSTAGAVQASLAFTKAYMNNTNVEIKVMLKDTIFMTNKYWPSNNQLRIRLNTNIARLIQRDGNNIATATMTSANFYLKRVFLTDESSSAFSSALMSRDLVYNLPYSRIAVYDVPAGAVNFNVPQVFSDNFRPDLVCIYTVLDANTQALPLTACAPTGYNAVAATGLNITNAYVQMDGEYFPERTAGDTYLGCQYITAYKEYVKNCLVEESEPYLDFLHWANHYSVICINTRKDKDKWYTCPPTESNTGFNLYVTLAGGGGAAKMYVVAFNNVKLTIDKSGQVLKHGF